ncbi:DUF1236 domain-containing protein [Alsobacter sp. R-9]
MQRTLMLAAAAALLASAAPAFAQSSTTTTTTKQETTGAITIAPEQRTKIKEYVVKEKHASVPAPAGFTVSAGATVPSSVELYAFGPDVGVTQYRYTVIGGRTVLVEPGTRRIVQIIE